MRLALILALAGPACAQGLLTSPEARQVELDRFLARLDSQFEELPAGPESVHLSLIDLADPAHPRRAGLRDRGKDPAASVIKLAVMAYAFEAQARGLVSFDQEVEISTCNMTATMSFPPQDDPGLAINNKPLEAGARWRVRDLVQVMIQRSDNPATNTLIDLLGREKITGFARSLGLESTRVERKLRGRDGDRVCEDGSGANAMPPYDAASLLALIAQGRLVSPEASQAMLQVLSGQLDRELIAAGVEKWGASYYGKTGSLSRARNDAAIVTGPGRRYVLAVYLHPRPSKPAPLIAVVAEAVDAELSPRGR